MSSPQSLQTLGILLEKVSNERDEAQAHLGECVARADAAHAQAGELTQYRSDYQQRWGRQFAKGGTMEIVNCYQNFSGKLDEAIVSQGNLASYADQRVEAARTQLLALEMRVAAIKKLIERREAEIQHQRQRQEQKATDEFAARIARDQARDQAPHRPDHS
jgi:flagellar FliJ protein